jgi:hypothetical protein
MPGERAGVIFIKLWKTLKVYGIIIRNSELKMHPDYF